MTSDSYLRLTLPGRGRSGSCDSKCVRVKEMTSAVIGLTDTLLSHGSCQTGNDIRNVHVLQTGSMMLRELNKQILQWRRRCLNRTSRPQVLSVTGRGRLRAWRLPRMPLCWRAAAEHMQDLSSVNGEQTPNQAGEINAQ